LARLIFVGKRGGRPSVSQSDINTQLVSFAREGATVIRLKGGDPSIFGRANEEIATLNAAGIAIEIVPGVTAATAAAAALQKSLTDRGRASRVQFMTAHGPSGEMPDDIDWAALSDPRATTIVYMGVRTLPLLTERLREHGLIATTPVIVVENAGSERVRCLNSTLGDVAEALPVFAPEGPCVVLIGAALGD
jgi:uroporphyrin-III C-methyltransferase